MSNLVNPAMTPSDLIVGSEIEFLMNPPDHLLLSSCIISKRIHYSLANHCFLLFVNSTSTQKNKVLVY